MIGGLSIGKESLIVDCFLKSFFTSDLTNSLEVNRHYGMVCLCKLILLSPANMQVILLAMM